MNTTVAVALLVGGLLGLLVGRVWAEVFRARFEMRKAWRARKDYRQAEQRHILPVVMIAALLLAVYFFGS